jgi:hypothetical protein
VSRPQEFAVNIDAKIVGVLGLRDGEGAIRVIEVKVCEGGTMGVGHPLGVIKGDEFCLITVNSEAISDEPAHHVLKALGS